MHSISRNAFGRQPVDGLPALMMADQRKYRKVKVIIMTDLIKSKENALKAYKEAKKAYLENMTSENWKAFCNAKIVCMRLGVII